MCKAIAVERGCGSREEGGLYLEVGLGPGGRPVEDFLMDPPVVVDPDALGLSSIGVKLIEQKTPDGRSVWHVFDIVGSKHYPNVADFVEECRRFGISRRVSKTIDFSKLTEDSRLVLLHHKAWVEQFDQVFDRRGREAVAGDWDDYRNDPPPNPLWACPKNIGTHKNFGPCSSIWWEDVEGGEQEPNSRRTRRKMPSFEYTAYAPHPVFGGPGARRALIRKLAIFGSFPLHRIVAVRDRAGNTHEEAAEKARAASLPVEFEDK